MLQCEQIKVLFKIQFSLLLSSWVFKQNRECLSKGKIVREDYIIAIVNRDLVEVLQGRFTLIQVAEDFNEEGDAGGDSFIDVSLDACIVGTTQFLIFPFQQYAAPSWLIFIVQGNPQHQIRVFINRVNVYRLRVSFLHSR
ncbi:hypothetical protein FGO68_gene13115 [Halteria grandinella]|uniref:Uncharacterized protein n=1 Tax=Halteria grandinella TaxID=5974 RepID=A0A8J8P1X4_HALGN|nr:hypothetical protein FGO68_gene13115 [Halteria grandinella]